MISLKKHKCQQCGCNNNDQNGNLHLHLEIENLKQRLVEKEHHIVNMETNFLKEADKYPNGEYAALTEELMAWQEKYSRLYEAHKRVQKVNQNLEDKLLKMVDKCETEKNVLNNEIGALTRKLIDEQYNHNKVHDENERYRNDLNLAIQLLQCKPSNYITQKCDSLPSEYQAKVRSYINSKQRRVDGNGNVHQKTKPEAKVIKVPIPTFPPTAMVYSLNKAVSEKDIEEIETHHSQEDLVSAAIMAKILEEREKERLTTKHCNSCSCSSQNLVHKTTQTNLDDVCRMKSPTSSLSSRDGLLISLHDDGDTPGSTPSSSKKSLKLSHTAASQEPDLINLSSGSDISDVTQGGRHCSVRLQAGSNNILLDNASEFSASPIMYKSRYPATIQVHSARSRSGSASSDENSSHVMGSRGQSSESRIGMFNV